MGIENNRQDFSSISNHRSEIPMITSSSHPSISTLTNKIQHPISSISILNENLPYLNNPSFSEDLNMFNIPGPEDHNSIQQYTKLKIPGFDDCEPATSLTSIQPDLKALAPICQNVMNNQKQNNQNILGSVGEVKILGPKNPTPEMLMQYQDLKFLNSYEQFLKSSHFGPITNCSGELMEVKVLGKKLETGILTNLDESMKKSVCSLKIRCSNLIV